MKLNNKIYEFDKLMKENNILKEKIEIQYNEINNLKEGIKEDIETLKNKLETQNIKYKEIENAINEINKVIKPIKMENKRIIVNKAFEESNIIKKDEYNLIIEAIESRIQRDIGEIKLLYKASVDGGEPKSFHEKCDNIANTLILIRSNENKRFGGFTSATWDSSSELLYKDDINSFLFSLDRHNIYPNKDFNCAICCKDSFGPIFGCFPSISISGNPLKGNKLCLNETNDLSSYDFQYDTNFFLADGGSDCISANEYEIFQIIF
jgi:hypothetical protein